jgi:hypothetical protein
MRKIVSLFLVMILVFSVVFTGNAKVFAEQNGDFTYITVDNSFVAITGYTGTGGQVTVPSELGGYTVSELGISAFSENSLITGISIPAGLVTIDLGAFDGLSGLTRIDVDENNTSLSSDQNGILFNEDKDSLIKFPAGKTGSYIVPNSVSFIENNAFEGCIGLTDITLTENITSIGHRAFDGCSGLDGITLPQSLTHLGMRAFNACSGFTEITIPKNIVEVGDNTFHSCTNLTQINVDEDNLYYSSQDGVLFDLRKEMLIRYPAGKTGVEYTIPDTVRTVYYGSFSECIDINLVNIPVSVLDIGNNAFEYCDGLTQINVAENNLNFSDIDGVLFDKTPATLLKYPEGKTGRYIIPGSITAIVDNAFSSCGGITDVVVPENVSLIGFGAFDSCSSLTAAYFLGNAPETMYSNAFHLCAPSFKVFFINGKSGFDNPWYEYETVGADTLPPPISTATPTVTPTPTPTVTPTITPTATPKPVAVTKVAINKATMKIEIAQKIKLTATVSPINAAVKSVKWKSSNSKIAAVSSTGYVTGIGKGSATITVTTVSGNKTAICKVTVVQPVRSVVLNKKSLTVKKGSTYKLTATVNPSNASNKNATWKSGNKAIATVSSKGIVKGIKKGTVYIYVYTVDGNKSARCKVTVK